MREISRSPGQSGITNVHRDTALAYANARAFHVMLQILVEETINVDQLLIRLLRRAVSELWL